MLLLFFIFAIELASIFRFSVLPSLKLPINPLWLIFFLFFLQFFFAPLQGSFSDNYCRRKSLIISFSAIFLGLLVVSAYDIFGLPSLILGIFLIGTLGNADVISRAALIDVNKSKSRRYLIGVSFLA